MIRAQGLSKSFGGVHAVQDVSLSVPEKSIFALIGPNGAGKSTLLNLLSGIYQPDRGSLQFSDRDLIGVPAYARVRLGIARTFQKIRLFKQLTLLENVRAGFHIHQDAPFWEYLLRGNTGRFHRIHRGVYALGHTNLSFEGRCTAAVLALGEGAVVSHLSAAALWGMPCSRPGRTPSRSGTCSARSSKRGCAPRRARSGTSS